MTETSDVYIFVSEHLDPKSGKTGTRYSFGFRNKAEAGNSPQYKNPKLRVIAEGITEDEARDLIALTPEVSLLTSAVEDIFVGPVKDTIITGWVNVLRAAYTRIKENRERRATNHLTATSNNLNVLDDITEDNLKNKLYKKMMEQLVMADEKGDLPSINAAFMNTAQAINTLTLIKNLTWIVED